MGETVIGNIAVRIRARNEQLIAGLKGANRAISSFGSKFRADFGALALASAAAGAAVAAAAFKTIKAFGIQEQAIESLNQALRNQGAFTAEATQELQDHASALQKVTTFGDETIISLQAQLVSFGLTGDALKDVTKTTLDFASAKKIDLKVAADLVGKAFVGETGSLSRYGIIIDKNIPKTEKFAAVINDLNSKFGGQAEVERQTTLGQLKAMSNSFGDLQETLGAFLAGPATKFAVWMTNAIDSLIESIAIIREASQSWKELGITIVRAVVQALADASKAVIRFIQNMTGLGPLLKLVGVDMDLVNAKIDAQIDKMNNQAQVHLATVQQRLATERIRAQEEAKILKAENKIKVDEAKKLALATVETEAEKQEALKKIAKEVDEFNAEAMKNAETRAQELQATREASFQAHKSLLTSVANESERTITSVFDANLSLREKKQKIFAQLMGLLQRQITNAVISSFATQRSAAIKTSIVETGAAKAPIAANFFKATAGIPFVGQAIALGFIAAAFGFIDRVAKFQQGGLVRGVGRRDTVPALLTPGERVLSREENRAFTAGVGNGRPVNVNVSITGQFLEADEDKWRQVFKKILGEVQRHTMIAPTSNFFRRRGSPV